MNASTNVRKTVHNSFYVEDEATGTGVDLHFDQLNSKFRFQHPVPPVSDADEELNQPIIEFRTPRLFVNMRRTELANGQLEDSQGAVVGQLDLFQNENICSVMDNLFSCELIFIASATNYTKWEANVFLWEALKIHEIGVDKHKCCPIEKSGGHHEVYFVMWIEWEDAVAYRKTIGHVTKEFWDSAETEEIDIRLG